jgi:hypothetical protein
MQSQAAAQDRSPDTPAATGGAAETPTDASPVQAPARASTGLPFNMSMQTLQEIAGISALGSFVFAIAATLSAAAYLSAWSIPATLVSLNPITALTKAGELIYTFVLVGLIWVVLAESHRRTRHHRGYMAVILVIVAIVLIGLGIEAGLRGFFGATLASIATYALFVGLRVLGRLPLAPTILALIVVVLLTAFQTGHELGLKRQTDQAAQTHLQLTLRAPLAGLPNPVIDGPSYKYDQLYLIFQDDQYVYIGSNVAPGHAWLVGIGQIVAMTVDS